MRLYLIRHPKPSHTEGMCYGRLDVAVSSDMVAAALTEVRQHIPAAILRDAPIYASPLSRCAQFASALAQPRTALVANELIEMDFGSWEGKSWNQIPRAELDNWAQDIWAYRPGGGENAGTLAVRWQRWCDRISITRHEAVIAVTHAGLIRVVLARAGRLALGDGDRYAIEFGSVHYIDDAHCLFGSRPGIGASA